MSQRLPPSASVAQPVEGAKLCAPSALRNAGPIADLLARHAPPGGQALEIASGTGQHVIEFATRLPGLDWQPTDPAADRRASIDAYREGSGLSNIRPALPLDAAAPGWSLDWAGQSLIVLCNLLHLISDEQADMVVSQSCAALAQGGVLVLYGPFKRDGVLISDGDIRFDRELRAADPAIGYKDDTAIKALLGSCGLQITSVEDMPANNLALVATRV